jgi:hypothetical protein
MKLALLALILLVASCAPSQPYRPRPGAYPGSTGGGTSTGGITSQTAPVNNYGQDAIECERKAALSQAGSKGEAFASCMRSRGHTPGR